jgi:HSP20 family protein
VVFKGWDPIRDLLAIQHRLDRFAPSPGGWVPPVDIYETADVYVIAAELPGLQRDDLRIHIEGGRVTLEGVRGGPHGNCERYHRVERGYGAFSRTFQLPAPIDAEQIVATLRHGVLTVTCPKANESSPRRVRVS